MMMMMMMLVVVMITGKLIVSEADDDDGDNDNGGADINDGNDANGDDSMGKADVMMMQMVVKCFISRSMLHFYTPWKCQKTKGFLTFSGGVEMEHWPNMGLVKTYSYKKLNTIELLNLVQKRVFVAFK